MIIGMDKSFTASPLTLAQIREVMKGGNQAVRVVCQDEGFQLAYATDARLCEYIYVGKDDKRQLMTKEEMEDISNRSTSVANWAFLKLDRPVLCIKVGASFEGIAND